MTVAVLPECPDSPPIKKFGCMCRAQSIKAVGSSELRSADIALFSHRSPVMNRTVLTTVLVTAAALGATLWGLAAGQGAGGFGGRVDGLGQLVD